LYQQNQINKMKKAIVLLIVIGTLFASCSTTARMNKRTKGMQHCPMSKF
jgi:hypothetical protein